MRHDGKKSLEKINYLLQIPVLLPFCASQFHDFHPILRFLHKKASGLQFLVSRLFLATTDGTRTRTPVEGREILSLLRLPFRHCSRCGQDELRREIQAQPASNSKKKLRLSHN